MHGQPAIITLRNDSEIVLALDALGVTEGNRTAVIKAAILHYAADQCENKGEVINEIRAGIDELDRKLGIYLGLAS